VGNLNDYVKFQMAKGMTKGEGGAMAGTAAQLGAGLAMGQQIAQSMGAGQATPPAAPPPLPPGAATPAPAGALPDVLTPVDAAKALGVTETDVLAALTEGSLKGKKIGTAWRITRAALDEFLKS
jgi:excisionase family DNA binding protein